ncbi:MAG TPA: DegT/DnrJ/EryC1/StrS family aminotransferase [Vicinamibacterales bacterium]|nr:DegT/DnrJ/EryC1/StrS family aminotransferase [Vicinamibacterales bacterium]
MSVPLLDLQAQYWPLREELLAAVTRVCDSQRFILGSEVDALEQELVAVLEAPHAIAVSSGTDAILCALMALGIGPGDEVITSTYSFFATAGCIARVGATPKLVDIDPVTYNLSPDAVARAVTPRTRAIVPVHLYGLCADMDPIVDIAARANVPIIEDAAQAIGATYKGRQAGTIGLVGCFSFFPSKNLGAFGDGGLVTCTDDRLAHEIRLLRNHGAEPKYFHKRVGGNFRLDALQAAVLRVKLPHLERWSGMRRANAVRYGELFDKAGLAGKVTLPVEPHGYLHIFNQYIVRVPDRDRVRQALTAAGIGTEVYYPVPFHLQECFASLGHRRGDFPAAEAAADSTLALPIYGELTAAQQAQVVSALADAIH